MFFFIYFIIKKTKILVIYNLEISQTFFNLIHHLWFHLNINKMSKKVVNMLNDG